jgi:ComF family protein
MHILLDIYNLFFPEVCLSCSNVLTNNEKIICTNCNFNLPLSNYTNLKNNTLETSFKGRITIKDATSLLLYYKKGIVQKLIHQLKYKNQQEIGTFFGNWLGNEIKKSNRFKNLDYIIPVPLHKKRFQERGYNQLDYFGNALSQILEIPYETNLLKKVTNTKKQSKKNRFARMDKVETIFSLNNYKDFSGKHFLLIDDVITTGATIESCYTCLSKIENSEISIAVIAFTKN